MNRFLFFVLFTLLIATTIISAQSNSPLPSNDEFRALLGRAYEQANLWSTGAPAFHLRARTTGFQPKRAVVEGTYELWWESKDRWREDIKWGNQSRSQIAGGKQLWTTGEDTNRADSSAVTNVLKAWQGIYMDTRKAKIQMRAGMSGEPPYACASGPTQTICLDPETGSLSETQDRDRHWEYSDYVKLLAKRYPRRIRFINGKDPVVEVNVEVLESLNVAQTVAFAPPEGALSKAWCSDMVSPVPTLFGQSSIIPRNYADLGMVVLTVDEKGRTTDVRVYQPGGAHLIDKNLRSALMLNTFKPAMCHGVAVPGEFVIWQ